MMAAAASHASKPDDALPPLREDLSLSDGPVGSDGARTWRVYDPLRHRYTSIDWATSIALSLWQHHTSVTALAVAISQRLGKTYAPEQIGELVRFLRQQSLLGAAPGEDWRKSAGAANKPHSFIMSLVHNYLFFRVPLFAPEAFLRATHHFARPFFDSRVQVLIAAIGLVGLYFVSRQWDAFLADARALSTAAGLAQFAIMLFCVKVLHEFGHAYAAAHYSCRVPVMGVAFMMMAPVLYTDVTDAWRLTDRRQRLAIDLAGVAVEVGLACVATLLWVFLPAGAPRQIAFLLATTSWIMSIAINLNPLMRFDGYYILADMLGVENLQARAFDMGAWRMREILFGLGQPPPEIFTARLANTLIFYAWSTWIYRVGMFTGIALAVYAYFFKALGIALFLFEIGYFLAKPIAAELKAWWIMRGKIMRTWRTLVSLSVLGVCALLFVLPWSSHVAVPAVLDAANIAHMHAPRPARVSAVLVTSGQVVDKGQVLIRLDMPDLEQDMRITQSRLQAVEMRLGRTSADREDRDETLVLDSTRATLRVRLQGLLKEQQELIIRAPFSGVIAEVNPQLHVGRWIGVKEPMALLRGLEGVILRGYVSEAHAWRIAPGTVGRFIPDVLLAPQVPVVVSQISTGAVASVDLAELTAAHGGAIDAQNDAKQRAIPSVAQFVVTLATVTAVAPQAVAARQRGVVHLSGERESYMSAVYRRILKVLVRESAA